MPCISESLYDREREISFNTHTHTHTHTHARTHARSVWQCVAVCGSVWQSVAVCVNARLTLIWVSFPCLWLLVAVCCRVLQCVAVVVCEIMCDNTSSIKSLPVAVRCSMLQCVTVRCSVLQWVWVMGDADSSIDFYLRLFMAVCGSML